VPGWRFPKKKKNSCGNYIKFHYLCNFHKIRSCGSEKTRPNPSNLANTLKSAAPKLGTPPSKMADSRTPLQIGDPPSQDRKHRLICLIYRVILDFACFGGFLPQIGGFHRFESKKEAKTGEIGSKTRIWGVLEVPRRKLLLGSWENTDPPHPCHPSSSPPPRLLRTSRAHHYSRASAPGGYLARPDINISIIIHSIKNKSFCLGDKIRRCGYREG